MFSFFLRNTISHLKSDKLRLLSTAQMSSPCVLQVITWSPGIKTKDKDGQVTYRQLLPFDAKRKLQDRLFSRNQQIEVLGHAAARFDIDLRHKDLNPDFKKYILDFAAKKSKNPNALEKVTAYISWFPESLSESGEHAYTGQRVDFEGKLNMA